MDSIQLQDTNGNTLLNPIQLGQGPIPIININNLLPILNRQYHAINVLHYAWIQKPPISLSYVLLDLPY